MTGLRESKKKKKNEKLTLALIGIKKTRRSARKGAASKCPKGNVRKREEKKEGRGIAKKGQLMRFQFIAG